MESQKLLDNLSRLNANVEHLQSRMEAEHREMSKRIDTLTYLLTGNGEPEKGLVVQMDRLREGEKRRIWWTRTALTAAIVSLIHTIYKVLVIK